MGHCTQGGFNAGHRETSVDESSVLDTGCPQLLPSSSQCKTVNHLLLFSLRYLVEQRDVELNVRDKWDSTPL